MFCFDNSKLLNDRHILTKNGEWLVIAGNSWQRRCCLSLGDISRLCGRISRLLNGGGRRGKREVTFMDGFYSSHQKSPAWFRESSFNDFIIVRCTFD